MGADDVVRCKVRGHEPETLVLRCYKRRDRAPSKDCDHNLSGLGAVPETRC
jgi:hypothetical protein